MTTKNCGKCKEDKPIDDFPRQRTGKHGRHSYCKPCNSRAAKMYREMRGRSAPKRAWLLHTRYRITCEQVDQIRDDQGALCAICDKPMGKECIDHNHATGAVRGLLCQKCNIRLGAVEDSEWLQRAQAYLLRPPVHPGNPAAKPKRNYRR